MTMGLGNTYEPHGEIRTPLWLLLPIRLYVGVHFVAAALSKVSAGFLSDPTLLSGRIQESVTAPDYPYGVYQWFAESLVIPHGGVFVLLVIFGELMAGLAITMGAFTRLACVAGIFMVANFHIAFDKPFLKAENTTSFAAMMLVLILTGAGRAYGGDHYIKEYLPKGLI